MEEVLDAVVSENLEVVDVQFRPGQKVYFFDPDGLKLSAGDHVILDTARRVEYGVCTSGNRTISAREAVAPLRKVLRLANAQDERIVAENRSREGRAFDVCCQRIQAHGLDMQLVSVECSFDANKITFYFTADERVDFRELVKDLASIFHARIELRQIGVRDKAKMVGGLGICGRPFCCASFLADFQPVSIKMAKTQSLSLNPTKISGTCGRLMCCLKYEQDTYESLIRSSPKLESLVDTPDGRGVVVEQDILRQRVKVRMEREENAVNSYANDEIAVLRSGKAKKNDPPIPDDLAPISGSGKRVKPQEDTPVLEAIRFRYRDESIADEQVAQESEQDLPESPPFVQESEPRSARLARRRARGTGETEEHRDVGNRLERRRRPRRPGDQAERPARTEKVERSARAEKNEKSEAASNLGDEAAQTERPTRAVRPYRRYNNRRRRPQGGSPQSSQGSADNG